LPTEFKHHDKIGFIPGIQRCSNIHKLINTIQHINVIKDKNYTIISTDAEKAFDKTQHPFVIKLGIKGTHLNTIKVAYDKPIANVVLKGKT
jgi:hypothetical protein